MSVSLVRPHRHIHVEYGECDSCYQQLLRKDDGPWQVKHNQVDDRLEELISSEDKSRLHAKNGDDWLGFVDQMCNDDELWTLQPALPKSVLVAIVNKGVIKESKHFKR